jgi:glycosyltransferase involved in cell wall biosynthesis
MTRASRTGLVSVILPTCDRVELLRRCVKSVAAQTHRELEIVIVDDASLDSTKSALEWIIREDSRVRFTSLRTRSGPQVARNTAISLCRGKFITNIDDDDEMLPNRVAALLAGFNESTSLVCSGFFRKSDKSNQRVHCTNEIITLDKQLSTNRVGNSALTLRERIVKVGLFDEDMPAWQDYDLWTRIITQFGPGLRLREPTLVVHLDHESPRVSRKTLQGAEQFLLKHQHLMQTKHIRRQYLEAFFLSEKKMSFNDFVRHISLDNAAKVIRYFITSNLPSVRQLRLRI